MIKNIIKGLISTVVLCLIFYSIDFELLKNTRFDISLSATFLILILLITSLFIRSYRWSVLMNDRKMLVNQLESFKLLLVGSSLNIFLPSGTGDIAKSYYGFKWTGIKERMVAVSLLDKLIAVGCILFITPFAFYFSKNYLIILAGVFSIIPFIFIYNYAFLNKYKLFNIPFNFLSKKLKKINLELLVTHFKTRKLKIAVAFLISILGWVITYIIFFFCLKTLNLNIEFHKVLAFIPFLVLGRLFPFTLNGIGTDEALIIFLFSSSESQNEPLLFAALLFRIIVMIIPAMVGLFYMNKNYSNK